MTTLSPDARARRIAAAFRNGEVRPEDPLDGALYDVLAKAETIDEDVAVAWDLYEGPEHHVLDALLLVRANIDDMCEALGLTAKVVEAYRALFFDTNVFKHAFAVRRYIGSIQDTVSETSAYQLALQEGADAVLDRYRVSEPPPADPIKTAQKVMTALAARAREHRGRPLTSKYAQEAIKAGRVALDAANVVRGMQPKNGGDSAALRFELALTTKNHTIPATESPVPLAELVRTGPDEKT